MEVLHQDDLHLIELLSLANHSPTGWQEFLDTLASHYNLNCCNLYLINPASQGIRFQDWSGKKPSDIELSNYMMNYFHSDTTHTLMLTGPCGEWLTPNIREDKELLESTAAYQEWAIPNNFIYSTGTTLFKDPDSICAIHFNRGMEQPPFTQSEEDRFTTITPFITKAVKLRLQIASKLGNNSLINSTLNTFRLPVAILNEFGEVISKNKLMSEYISASDSIELNNKILSIDEKDDDFSLQLAIANSIASAKNKHLDYTPKEVIIKGMSTKHRLGVCELIEHSDSKDEVFLGAMLYLAPEGMTKSVTQKQLEALFNLTKTESLICTLLLRNIPIKTISEMENKSIHTVREQIQNCYIKTGTSNQLELVNLIGCMPISTL